MVRAREVVLPWVHVWSTMMSDRFRSVHFTRRSSCYAAATKPGLTCLSERVFKKGRYIPEEQVQRCHATVQQYGGGVGVAPPLPPPPPLPSHLPPWQV